MSDIVLDTFTAADNTDIESHTGETGATWTRDAIFGQGNGSGRTFGIFSNKLRRLTFGEQPAADGGNSLVRPSGLLPGGTTEFYIVVPVTFVIGGSNATIELYENAINPGNSERLVTFGQNLLDLNASGAGGVSFSIVAGTEYELKLHISGVDLEIYLDNVLLDAGPRGAQPIEPFGLNIFDGGSDGDANVNSFNIYPAAPPGAFWTDYVLTRETIV